MLRHTDTFLDKEINVNVIGIFKCAGTFTDDSVEQMVKRILRVGMQASHKFTSKRFTRKKKWLWICITANYYEKKSSSRVEIKVETTTAKPC